MRTFLALIATVVGAVGVAFTPHAGFAQSPSVVYDRLGVWYDGENDPCGSQVVLVYLDYTFEFTKADRAPVVLIQFYSGQTGGVVKQWSESEAGTTVVYQNEQTGEEGEFTLGPGAQNVAPTEWVESLPVPVPNPEPGELPWSYRFLLQAREYLGDFLARGWLEGTWEDEKHNLWVFEGGQLRIGETEPAAYAVLAPTDPNLGCLYLKVDEGYFFVDFDEDWQVLRLYPAERDAEGSLLRLPEPVATLGRNG